MRGKVKTEHKHDELQMLAGENKTDNLFLYFDSWCRKLIYSDWKCTWRSDWALRALSHDATMAAPSHIFGGSAMVV